MKGTPLHKKLKVSVRIVLVIIIVLVFYLISNRSSLIFNYYYKYGNYRISELSGPFSIQINLNDPESNVGRVLCQNDGCEIYVEKVDLGYYPGYTIVFRSPYKCTWSGIQQLTTFFPDGGYGLRYIPVFYWDGSEKMDCGITGYSGDIYSVSVFIPNEEDTLPNVITIEFPYVCLRTWT